MIMIDDGTSDSPDPPPAPAERVDASAPRRDTPLLPPSVPPTTHSRATLVVLTGVHAGRIVAIHTEALTIGRAPESDLVIDEIGVSHHHARIGSTAEGGFYLEDLASTNGTFLATERVGLALLRTGDLLRLGPHIRLRFAVVDAVEESLYRHLYESSMHDPLTHLFNRRYMTDHLTEAVDDSRLSGGAVAVLMIDVDALKDVNDRFGHLAGDRALCTVGARILRSLRAGDVLARYGGDEFVVLATGTDTVDTLALAERVRRAVEGLNLSARGHEVRMTASIGVAALVEVVDSDDPAAALLALADSRMYRAKASGKNRVCT
jgi:diguanylate cyclase (GGDEF)-like protein